MKRFSKLMSLLLFAAVTQYSCINDADVVSPMILIQSQMAISPCSSRFQTLLPVEVPNRPALPPKVLKKNMQ